MLWLLAILFLPATLQAQSYEDVLYLKNGWVLRGTLIGSANDSLVRIETRDQNLFVFPHAEVLRAEQKVWVAKRTSRPVPAYRTTKEINYRDKGYFLLAQIGTLAGSVSTVNNENPNVFNPHIINGYRFNHFVSAGAGVGINLLDRGAYMPVFLDVRGDLLKQKMTPHYYTNVGYAIPLYAREDVVGWWGEPIMTDFNAKGGILMDGGAGVKIYTPSGFAWLLTGGYRFQQVEESYKTWGDVLISEKYTIRRISLQVGVMF
ncbi:MAG: hypothetical protein R3D00_10010 [Bacteroidia bacterium]